MPGIIYAAVEDAVAISKPVKGLYATHYSIMYFDKAYLKG